LKRSAPIAGRIIAVDNRRTSLGLSVQASSVDRVMDLFFWVRVRKSRTQFRTGQMSKEAGAEPRKLLDDSADTITLLGAAANIAAVDVARTAAALVATVVSGEIVAIFVFSAVVAATRTNISRADDLARAAGALIAVVAG